VGLIDEATEALAADRAERDARAASAKARKGRSQRFYSSFLWRKLRYKVLAEHNGRCQACGRGAADGIVLNVDHIEPLSKNWERRLDRTNLQVLCAECNHGKLNYEAKDWRILDQHPPG
jgi:5-methylcytosine-specific restriction endonuclease McrA